MSINRHVLALTASLYFGVGCASTSLDTPAKSAANPNAHTMPISKQSPALSDDFDPWQGGEENSNSSEDAHGGHHHE